MFVRPFDARMGFGTVSLGRSHSVPKMKTHKGAAKRFRRRNSGSILRGKARSSHNRTRKSGKLKMDLRQPGSIHRADARRVRRMLAV